jgi:hypothetical protein
MTLISALRGSLRYKSSSSFYSNGLRIYYTIPVQLFLLRIDLIYLIFINLDLSDYYIICFILSLY